jgi:hypothetical protein
MASYLQALIAAHGELDSALGESQDAGLTIRNWAARAREDAVADGSTTGAAIGERALASTLLRTLTADTSLRDLGGERAAVAWRDNRGDRATMVRRYLGAVLEQYTRHVVARDMGRLVSEGRSPGETRELTRKLGTLAREVAETLPAQEATAHSEWVRYIGEAFAVARTLPPR